MTILLQTSPTSSEGVVNGSEYYDGWEWAIYLFTYLFIYYYCGVDHFAVLWSGYFLLSQLACVVAVLLAQGRWKQTESGPANY